MSALIVALIAFVAGFVGSVPIAGPVAILLIATCVKRRYDEAVRLAMGAAVAEGLYAFAAFFGFATFLVRYRWMLPVSHGFTAVLLLVLGLRFLVWDARRAEQEPAPPGSRASGLVAGFLVSALNPTLLATWSVVVTALYARRVVRMTQLLAIPFGVASAAGIFTWSVVLVYLMKRYQEKFPRWLLTWTVRAMGALLIVLAMSSARELMHCVQRLPAR